MRDDFASRLQSGSADFAAKVIPASADAIRARGNRRRHRKAITSTVLAVAISAGGAGTAYTSLDRLGHDVPMATSSSSAPSPGEPGRPEIVAVTTRGALVVLNSLTGVAVRILVPDGVVSDAVSVSPDGATVYFAVRHGCVDEIESVPVAGGRPTVIAPGVLPAVSPDGTRLAFAREPFGGGPARSDYLNGCHQATATGAEFKVVIRDLPNGHETLYPAPPGAASTLPYPISRLSWAPAGNRLLVSVGPSQDNEGWDLVEIDPVTSRYYLPFVSGVPLASAGVPLPGSTGAGQSYYREGVFLPDGDMLVNRVCCAGWPVRVTSSLLWEIDPSGHLVHQVAIGFADRDHSSLDADRSGHLLLYLSGHDLFVSLDGSAPFVLTSGLIAAAWV